MKAPTSKEIRAAYDSHFGMGVDKELFWEANCNLDNAHVDLKNLGACTNWLVIGMRVMQARHDAVAKKALAVTPERNDANESE